MGTRLIFTAELNVFDPGRLIDAATRHGRATGAGSDYEPATLAEALQMVLDCGPDGVAPCDMGFEFEHSHCEEAE